MINSIVVLAALVLVLVIVIMFIDMTDIVYPLSPMCRNNFLPKTPAMEASEMRNIRCICKLYPRRINTVQQIYHTAPKV